MSDTCAPGVQHLKTQIVARCAPQLEKPAAGKAGVGPISLALLEGLAEKAAEFLIAEGGQAVIDAAGNLHAPVAAVVDQQILTFVSQLTDAVLNGKTTAPAP